MPAAKVSRIQVTIEPSMFPLRDSGARDVTVKVIVNSKEYGCRETFQDADDLTGRFDQWMKFAAETVRSLFEQDQIKGNDINDKAPKL